MLGFWMQNCDIAWTGKRRWHVCFLVIRAGNGEAEYELWGDDYEGILLRSYGKTKVTWAAMMLISQLYILLQHSRGTRFFIDEKS